MREQQDGKIKFKTHGPKRGNGDEKMKKKFETIGKCFDMFFRSGSGRKCGNIKHRDVCEIHSAQKAERN